MQKHILLLCLLLCSVFNARAQALPANNMLLFSLQKSADSLWRPQSPRFLTGFNKQGYNNQPAFVSASEFYCTVQQADRDTTQTDLFAFNLDLLSKTQLTATTTSEYSPGLMPGGKRFCAVRVEADGSQRLWSFPVDRSDNGRAEFPDIRAVGYYCWLNDTLSALFIVGNADKEHVLYTAGLRGQKLQRVSGNPGRCLQRLPKNKLAFVHKLTDQTWLLKSYDPQTRLSETLVRMPEGTEDFVVLPDGSFLCGNGAKLFQFKPGLVPEWREVADLSRFKVQNISRLAFGGRQQLLVVFR